MVSTFTTNKSLEKPAAGDQPGTWGTATVNPNMDLIDSAFGGLTTVALLGTNVSLSSGQYKNTFIRFTGALTANIAVTFPAVGSFYTIINDCTNSSAFYVTALTSVGGGRVIGLPSGSMTQFMTDGTDCRYSTLPPVGTYWDFGGSSVPGWVGACTVPPWVNCDGTTFSSATYPALTALLGGTTLPDARGRARFALNQTTGRITTTGGLDGNTIFAGGGVQTITLGTSQIPAHDHGGVTGTTQTTFTYNINGANWGAGGNNTVTSIQASGGGSSVTQLAHSHTITSTGGGGAHANIPPGYVGGITLIRAG